METIQSQNEEKSDILEESKELLLDGRDKIEKINNIEDELYQDYSVEEVNEEGSVALEHLITEGNVSGEYKLLQDRKICYACETSQIDYYFNCGNGLCEDCLKQHLKAQLDKYKSKVLCNEIKFVCAGSCKCKVESEKMIFMMDQEIRIIYHEILLRMYLNKETDIISCAKSSCSNFNFLPNDIKCKCYECTACGHQWSDSKNISLENLTDLKTFLSNFSISNIKSQIKKYLITKYCNNCSVSIEKAEGCKHMECNRCEYSFCWKCMDKWQGHNEMTCMGLLSNEYEESFRPNFLPFVFWICIILVVLKFIFSFTFVLYVLYFLFKLIMYIIFILFDCMLLTIILNKKLVSRYKKSPSVALCVLIIEESILYYLELHPFSEKMYFYTQLTVVPLMFLGLLLKNSTRNNLNN